MKIQRGDSSYESALEALLSPGLHQATTPEEIARAARRRTRTVSDMRFYWRKLLRRHPPGPTPPHRRPLLLHITGTKGKGSTACLCEAVLRAHGYATGLFTSPHLIDVRERIRWHGRPVHKSLFAEVYWKVRRALEEGGDAEGAEEDPPPTLPGYFRMLTLMGLYTFLHHLSGRVDAIILEVGMGGRHDATNFLDASPRHFRRVVNGVTLLDLDHTRILGATVARIAWEKGGIFSVDKLNAGGTSARPSDGTTATTDAEEQSTDSKQANVTDDGRSFLSPQNYVLYSNTEEVVNTMRSCALVEGKGSELCLVDATGAQIREALGRRGLALGLAGEHQYGNAALAVALCRSATAEAAGHGGGTAVEGASSTTAEALASAQWPGRCQILEWPGEARVTNDEHRNGTVRFYLDGAHTPQSLRATVEWLRAQGDGAAEGSGAALPILVFNCSHERNPVELLELFLARAAAPPSAGEGAPTPVERRFSTVYFARSDAARPSPVAPASAESLLEERGIPVRSELLLGNSATRTWQDTLASIWRHLTMPSAAVGARSDSPGSVRCNLTAGQVCREIREHAVGGREARATQVFVTGSLYLVGSFLTALEWSEESSSPLTYEHMV